MGVSRSGGISLSRMRVGAGCECCALLSWGWGVLGGALREFC